METKKENKIKAVVFDCDGVMFDTDNANKMYYNGILEHFGKSPMTQEQFRFAHMSPVKEALKYIFQDMENIDAVFDYCSHLTYDSLIPHMNMESSLRELLGKLKGIFITAIATNRSNTMNGVLEYYQLKNDFQLVVTSLDVENPKPYPDQLFKIIDHFNIKPNEMLYIGDSTTDEQAALKAEVVFVAYDNKALQADYYISDLKEIEKILKI